MDPLTTLSRAVDQAAPLIAGVSADQMSGSTPCAEFDVRALLNHLVIGIEMFATAAAGDPPADPATWQRDAVGDDPAGAYGAAADKLKTALTDPGVADRTWVLPFGEMPGAVAAGIATLEVLQHGWDVARATGQKVEFDAELTQAGLDTAKAAPAEMLRQPGVFGPESHCADDAPLSDQLAAFLGRAV